MSSVSHVVYPLTWLMCPSYILGINKPASATGRHVPTVALIENFAAFPPALWLSVRLYAAAFPGLVCISGALSSIHGSWHRSWQQRRVVHGIESAVPFALAVPMVVLLDCATPAAYDWTAGRIP